MHTVSRNYRKPGAAGVQVITEIQRSLSRVKPHGPWQKLQILFKARGGSKLSFGVEKRHKLIYLRTSVQLCVEWVVGGKPESIPKATTGV